MRFLLAALCAVLLFAMLPVTQATAQSGSSADFDVTKVTPSVVGGGSPGEVVVSGRLTNHSGRALTGIQAQVERGTPPTSEPAVQRAMSDGSTGITQPAVVPVANRLEPGQSLPVQIRVPLTGSNSLQVSEPGIFPVMVSVQAGRSNLAEAQFLLPVTSLPGQPPLRPAQATPTSLVVPIVDTPRLEREALPGGRAVLVDDQLSTSLAPGGRLYDLVQAISDSAPAGSSLGNAMCFAIDPDLLITAKAMQGGYQVRQPNNTLVEGIGRSAADLWLTKLRQATAGRCVISLPYSDADVVALGRAGLSDLVDGAMDGSQLISAPDGLGVEPRDVMWPIEGALADPKIGDLPSTMLLDTRSMNIPAGSLTPVKLRGHDTTAIPIDPLMASALDPNRDTQQEVTQPSPPGSGALSSQNALGALAFRATGGYIPNATSVLVPPRRWNMRADDLRGLLTGLSKLDADGLIRLTALPSPNPATLAEADLTYPVQAGGSEIPREVIDKLAAQNFKVGDLARSSESDRAQTVSPGRVTTPLRNGLLHGVSSSWRGNSGAADDWVRRATGPINDMLAKVRIEEYPGTTNRLSSDSPIPVTVVNDLPFTVGIRFEIPSVPGVEVQHEFGGGLATVPANGRRQFMLEASAQRAGRFVVDISVTAGSGTPLGATKRLPMESTEYGALIPWLTGIAGAVLVLMSVRRIVNKAKARRERKAAAQQTPDAAQTQPLAHAATTASATHPPTTEGDRDRG
ncbi:DUF6049 family protein [Saccharopolyspora mangrovi]|uniref:DUF6049 family protein n=1 Tax=Saccharopolyspora mangrovi TaxID=3082379 RepID=A0ABU6AGU3_9PSEU|nr:DUF6049 family protein [Saccharopolyspora sp. S2-29]MEB3370731.1 DUF6049 family protein [Saccharopolyspora sp. S2-29]